LRRERVAEGDAVGHFHAEHHFDVARDRSADGDGVGDSGQVLNRAVNLGGANAHATRVERGVAAAVDDGAARCGHLDEVAVGPHSGKLLEIGGVILRAVRVVPELGRQRRKWARADQFAALADEWLALR